LQNKGFGLLCFIIADVLSVHAAFCMFYSRKWMLLLLPKQTGVITRIMSSLSQTGMSFHRCYYQTILLTTAKINICDSNTAMYCTYGYLCVFI